MAKVNIYFLLMIFFIFKSCAPKSMGNKTTVTDNERSLTFMLISDYCGGAPLSDEMLEDYRKEKPAANESITLISSDEGSEKIELTTNNLGEASTKIQAGTYNVYLSEKLETKAKKDFDEICLKWIDKQNGVLSISDDKREVSIVLKRTCNPCSEVSY